MRDYKTINRIGFDFGETRLLIPDVGETLIIVGDKNCVHIKSIDSEYLYLDRCEIDG